MLDFIVVFWLLFVVFLLNLAHLPLDPVLQVVPILFVVHVARWVRVLVVEVGHRDAGVVVYIEWVLALVYHRLE